MLNPILQTLDIKDFATNEAMQTVLSRCMVLRSDYWLKKLTSDKDLFAIVYLKAEDQISTLRSITKLINKGMVPTDDILDTLPCIVEKFEEIVKSRKRGGAYSFCDQGTELAVAHYKATNTGYFVLYTSSPINVVEDKVQYSVYYTPESNILKSELVRIAPDFYNFLLSHDTSDFKRDPVMEKKILEMMNRKRCYTCHKEPVTKKCSVCGCVYYCDAECQTINWNEHKKICQIWRLLKLTWSSGHESES